MEVWGFFLILYQFRSANSWWWGSSYNYPWHEEYHYPGHFTSTMTPYVNNTEVQISSTYDTPDYRIEEPLFLIKKYNFGKEKERPYRNSPPYKQSRTIWGGYDQRTERAMGCFCCTTYRRLTLLAGCAVISTKHILTTATSTSLILRSYAHLKSLENILGGWYDTDVNSFNSSMYFTPSRIHIHPQYTYDYEVNVSHPIPAMYDLSVWSATYNFYGGWFSNSNVIICKRAASGWIGKYVLYKWTFKSYDRWISVMRGHYPPNCSPVLFQSGLYQTETWSHLHRSVLCKDQTTYAWLLSCLHTYLQQMFEYTSSIPRRGDLSLVAGFQFMKAYKRRPMPWFRYIIKTDNYVWPCPKSDWHWFHCIMGEYWGRYGFDSGGGMSSAYNNEGWRRDGMVGLCAFSLKLRAKQTTHYFTVVDTWPVLDFMYDSFLGLKPPVYLDDRFADSKWSSPIPYWGEYIYNNYEFGYEHYYQAGWVPKYRR